MNGWKPLFLSETFAETCDVVRKVALAILLVVVPCKLLVAQNLSWVKGAMERSKQTPPETTPIWQYDPRIAAGRADASLNAIACPSVDRVWVVGDRGLILASADGGRSWQTQESGTSHNLYAVHFQDELHGLAVGGTIQPGSGTSVGIVLSTEDAGAHWNVVQRSNIPRLTGMIWSDRFVLRAWGDYSTVHGSAVLESFDGGRSWQGVLTPLSHMQTVARQTGGVHLGIDRAGRISSIPSKANQNLMQIASPLCPMNALIHTGNMWMAVGNRGTLATSRDGTQWIDQPLPLSPEARAVVDLRTLAVAEQHIWIGGSPGTILLHSSDQGRSWQVEPTDQSLPIQAIRFFDANRGWAVTEGGSILATRDGGKTWFTQRKLIERIGMYGVAATRDSVTWPALVEAVWNSRTTAHLEILHRENLDDAVNVAPDAPSTVATLATQIGLTGATINPASPIPDYRIRNDKILRQIYSSADANLLFDRLLVQLRMYKPTVVVIDDFQRDTGAMSELVLKAVQVAAQSEPRYQWIDRELQLKNWQVTKTFGSSQPRKANLSVTYDQVLRDSGISIVDALAPLLGTQSVDDSKISMRCLQLNAMSGSSNALKSSLIHVTDRHTETMRPVDLSNVGNLQLVLGRMPREKAWAALNSSSAAEEPIAQWRTDLKFVMDMSPKHEVGNQLVQLAKINMQAERWDRWYAALETCIAMDANQDASRSSRYQAIAYGASDERLAWQLQGDWTGETKSPDAAREVAAVFIGDMSSKAISNQTPFANEYTSRSSAPRPSDNRSISMRIGDQTPNTRMQSGVVSAEGQRNSDDRSSGQVYTASAVEPAAAEQPSPVSIKLEWLKRSTAELNQAAEVDKQLANRPDTVLAQFARRRALNEWGGEPMPDPTVLQSVANNAQIPGWQQAALQELSLVSNARSASPWIAHARPTKVRPILDGKADDACWQTATPISLTSPFDAQSAIEKSTVAFAYDDEYLFIQMHCPYPSASKRTEAPTQSREYDMQLDGSDHCLFLIDTDRDYVSGCELGVNDLGQSFDRSCQSKAWNPRWKIAVERRDGPSVSWNAELAIRLADLTTASTVNRRAWAISVFRYIPGHDVQSWSQLRSYNPRLEGNGLLLFEP